MVLVPAVIPVTAPEVEPIVATAGSLLDHAKPPDVAQLSTAVLPTHIVVVPVIAALLPDTVIGFVTIQPEPNA